MSRMELEQAKQDYQQEVRKAFDSFGFTLPVQEAIEQTGHVLALCWDRQSYSRKNYRHIMRTPQAIESLTKESITTYTMDGKISDYKFSDDNDHLYIRKVMLTPYSLGIEIDSPVYDTSPTISEIRHSLIFTPEEETYYFLHGKENKKIWEGNIGIPIMNELTFLSSYVTEEPVSTIIALPLPVPDDIKQYTEGFLSFAERLGKLVEEEDTQKAFEFILEHSKRPDKDKIPPYLGYSFF